MMLTEYSPDAKMQYKVGWILILATLFLILVNFIFIFISSLPELKMKFVTLFRFIKACCFKGKAQVYPKNDN